MVCAPVICTRSRIDVDTIRADTVRPYGGSINPYDPVHMIRHDHKFIFVEADFLSNFCRTEPFFLYDIAQRIELPLAIQHLPKQ